MYKSLRRFKGSQMLRCKERLLYFTNNSKALNLEYYTKKNKINTSELFQQAVFLQKQYL